MMKHAVRLFLVAALPALLAACGGSSGTTQSTIPVTTVTVPNAHSVAFTNHTTVALWGYNGSGQLGNGYTSTSYEPVVLKEGGAPVKGIKGVVAGAAHTLAFFNASTVHAWGANFNGQLGNNSTANGVLSPVGVLYKPDPRGTDTARLSHVVGIAAGKSHSLAIQSVNGVRTAWAWGANYAGQLGNGSRIDSSTAVQLRSPDTGSVMTGITAVAAGSSHSLALVGGEVWSWGAKDIDTTGTTAEITAASSVPERVLKPDGSTLDNIRLIAAGGITSVAVDVDNTIWIWGLNDYGQLGTDPGTVPPHSFNPVPRPFDKGGMTGNVLAVSVGLGHVLVLTDHGLWGWGFNGYGQVGGDQSAITSRLIVTSPQEITGFADTFDLSYTVNGLSPILAIGNHSLARTRDGRLWAWGINDYGQLGYTPVAPYYSATPKEVTGL